MVVAILGQDSPSIVTRPFDFPPCLDQDAVFALTPLSAQRYIFLITMKRTATEAFNPQLQETLPKVSNYLTLYVALNPSQFAQLQDDQPILPDPYSERFGLRSDLITAAERAHYFMSWAPPYCDAPEPAPHIKKYMICKLASLALDRCSSPRMAHSKKEMATTLSDQDTTAGMDPCTSA